MADGRCCQRSSSKRGAAILCGALSLLTLVPTSVPARPANGEFGPRSQGTIEIRVSVAPRFVPTASSDRSVDLVSLAPGLRYHIVAKDPQPTEPDRRHTLYLIVPD
jgi:hypothetical protein